jgi:hypothetical protein
MSWVQIFFILLNLSLACLAIILSLAAIGGAIRVKQLETRIEALERRAHFRIVK